MGFTNNKSESKYSPRLTDESSLVYGIKPSSEYLAGIRNNQSTGIITSGDLNLVQSQLNDLGSSRTSVDLTWRQFGPDNFGGRTRAIMFDNQDATANILYAAGVTGGIWKSENVGISWQKINSATYNLNVSCMKQDASGTIYAGTGESFAAETMSGLDELGFNGGFVGQGIFKSTDGENFTLIPSTQPQFNNDATDWAFVNEIAIDMNNGNLFAATNNGLMFSNDGGESWSVAKDVDGAELNMNSYDVQVSSDGAVVACIDNLCYISTAGDAEAFVNRSTGDSVSLPESGVNRIEFAYAPSDPNVLYASVVNHMGNLYNVYSSDDKGLNWRIILPGTGTSPIFVGQGVYDNALAVFPTDPDRIILGGVNAWEGIKIQEEGFYAWRSISSAIFPIFFPSYLHVDHHTYVFRPGFNNTFMIGSDGGVAIGTLVDNEYEFEQSNRSYFTTQFYSVGVSGDANFATGGAQDNGTILITGDGNTVKEGEEILNGDGCATVISAINKNVLVTSYPGRETDFLFRSENAGVDYSGQFLDSLSLAVNAFITPIALWESFDNPNSRDSVMYHATETIPGGTKLQVISENSKQPFYYTTPSDITLNTGDSLNVQDIVSSRFFIATFGKVYMTNELHQFDKILSWFEISNADVGLTGAPQSIAYSKDCNHVYVGTREGKLFRISNLALAYNYDRADVRSPECVVSTTEIPLTVPGTSDPISQVITSISVDPNDPSNVMVTLGNYGNDYYVLYTENGLEQTPVFNSRQGNLPQMPVYSSLLEMSDSDVGIIGTEHGVFVTEDIHASSPVWVREDSLMGSVPVFQLVQQQVSKVSDTVFLVNGTEITKVIYPGINNYGVIYAATFGRGLLRCNVFQRPVGVEDVSDFTDANALKLDIYPNPVSSYATLEFDAANSGNANISIYDLSGRKAMTLTNNVQKGINKVDVNLTELKSGSYIIQIVIGSDVYTQKIIAN